MTSRISLFATICAALAGVALSLPVASVSAAASTKVLLVKPGGPAGTQGESARIESVLFWPEEHLSCASADEHGVLGKNPAGTVKVAGSGAPIETFCFREESEESLLGETTVKGASLSRSGAVSFIGKFELITRFCAYRATKLTGFHESFGGEERFSDVVTGTAKLVGHLVSTCAKTMPVEGRVTVRDAGGASYVTDLAS